MENEQLIESYCKKILSLKDKKEIKGKTNYKKELKKEYGGDFNEAVFNEAWSKADDLIEEKKKVSSNYLNIIKDALKSGKIEEEKLRAKVEENLDSEFDEDIFSNELNNYENSIKDQYKKWIREFSNKSQKSTDKEENIKQKVQKKFSKDFREDIYENAKNEIQRENIIKREAAILSRKEQPLNQILFGPPGTGKTYISIEKALDIINPLWKEESRKTDEADLREYAITLYNKYVESGQIVFTTFHQSMSYEDFIEGIKPSAESTDNTSDNSHTIVAQNSPSADDMDAGEQGEPASTVVYEESAETKKTNNISYSVQPGIFKEICDKALLDYLCECFCQEKRNEGYRSTDDRLKKEVVSLVQNLMNENKKKPEENDFQSIKETGAFEEETIKNIMETIHSYKDKLQQKCYETASLQNIGDLFYKEYLESILAEINKDENNEYELQSGKKIQIKEIEETRKKEKEKEGEKEKKYKFFVTKEIGIPSDIFKKKLKLERTFGTTYEGYLPSLVEDYKNFVRRKKSTTPYVLIIDEINRGNIASIFGELITLIEDSKRLGRLNALTAKLPYSHEVFGVPDNLYIIGTMNTADRSVEALDSALRRRFVFEEMMPDSTCVPDWKENVGDDNNKIPIELRDIFDKINARLRVLKDRDHQIGHSYFMNIKDDDNKWEKLKDVFYRQIIPLLQEYFFNRYDLIAKVLGNGFVIPDNNSKLSMAVYDDSYDDVFTDRKIWKIVPEDDFYDKEFQKEKFIEAITKLLGSEIYNQYNKFKHPQS